MITRQRKPVLDRMAEKLALDDNDCLIWLGALSPQGYGVVSVGTSIADRAHRVVYREVVGPIPEGLTLDHVQAWGCRSRRCCAPWHLEPVTQSENARRVVKPDHCKRNHEFTEDNTYLTPDGHRSCRICRARAAREFRKRAKEGVS